MTEKSEALLLADRLESDFIRSQTMVDAAVELRRLHAENKVLHERHHDGNVILTQILAQRDALLAALKAGPSIEYMLPTGLCACSKCQFVRMRRAAIKMVEENK